MKVEITEAQLLAIVEMADTLSSMVGSMDMDFNTEVKKQVRLTDAFLKKNGYKRVFK